MARRICRRYSSDKTQQNLLVVPAAVVSHKGGQALFILLLELLFDVLKVNLPRYKTDTDRTREYTLLKIFKGADFQKNIFINVLRKILPDLQV